LQRQLPDLNLENWRKSSEEKMYMNQFEKFPR
jgi:hypothetical protein